MQTIQYKHICSKLLIFCVKLQTLARTCSPTKHLILFFKFSAFLVHSKMCVCLDKTNCGSCSHASHGPAFHVFCQELSLRFALPRLSFNQVPAQKRCGKIQADVYLGAAFVLLCLEEQSPVRNKFISEPLCHASEALLIKNYKLHIIGFSDATCQ